MRIVAIFIVLLVGISLGLLAIALLAGIPDAISNRDWEQTLVMGTGGLLFAGGSVAILLGPYLMRRKRIHQARALAAQPDEPWMWRRDWAERRIKGSTTSAGTLVLVWIFAIVANAMSWPIVFLIPDELDEGNTLMLLGLMFPLAALAVLALALYKSLQRRRFGRSALHLETLPGQIGGSLRATLRVPRAFHPEKGFTVTLTCIERKWYLDDDNSQSSTDTTLWSTEDLLERPAITHDPGMIFPLEFTIPYRCRPTRPRDGDDETLWQVQVHADLPGVDYSERFEVPVFRTAQADPDGKSV